MGNNRNTPEEMQLLEQVVRKVANAIPGIPGFAIAVVLPDGNVSTVVVGSSPESIQALITWAPESIKGAIERMQAGILGGGIVIDRDI